MKSMKMLAPTYIARFNNTFDMIKTSKGSALDIGCADGSYSRELARRGFDVNGFDINSIEMDKKNKLKIKYSIDDAKNMSFKNNTFDLAICIDIIEHIDDDEKVISEISRVLKTGGQVIISIPNKDFPITYDPINYVLNKFGYYAPIGIWGFGHLRVYPLAEIQTLLKKYGFKITECRRTTHYFAGLVENYISDILQPFTKKGGKNKEVPTALLKFFAFITKLDEKINSNKSVGIVISAEKI